MARKLPLPSNNLVRLLTTLCMLLHEFYFILEKQIDAMRRNLQGAIFLLSGLLFTASLVCGYFAIFVKTGISKNPGFVIFALILCRFGVVLFKSAKEKISGSDKPQSID